jgi:hypothetical protein
LRGWPIAPIARFRGGAKYSDGSSFPLRSVQCHPNPSNFLPPSSQERTSNPRAARFDSLTKRAHIRGISSNARATQCKFPCPPAPQRNKSLVPGRGRQWSLMRQLEKPVGQPDSRPKAGRESPGLEDTKRRMLRGENLAPSALSRIRCRLCGLWREGGEPSPKTAIGCNGLQFSTVEWAERPRLSPYNRHLGQNALPQASEPRNSYKHPQ